MIAGLAGLVVLFILVTSTLFTVGQTQQALITEFGRPVRVIEQPGLHSKIPFVQSVIEFDKRLLYLGTPSEEVILGDQRRLIVDSFTMFRITDPLQYYQAVGSGEEGIVIRLNAIVSSAIRRQLGTRSLPDVLSVDRDRIMASIRDQVNGEMKGFGVLIRDVRIRRADLPRENTEAILSRMQSERQRVAAQARAEGAESALKIRANADRDRTVLLADARATADQLRGEGEAEATRLYASAFGQDPAFFAAWRTLQAYKDAFASGHTRLILTPHNDFMRYLLTRPVPAPDAGSPSQGKD
jgi:membrane protease subunit HflC